jgi:plastocyanin
MKSKLIVFIFLVIAACVSSASEPKEVKLVPVKVEGYRFAPEKITIERGTTIEWINTGKDVHTITDEHASWDSGDLQPGEKFSRRFDEPGKFIYYCTPHRDIGMTGTIIVR